MDHRTDEAQAPVTVCPPGVAEGAIPEDAAPVDRVPPPEDRDDEDVRRSRAERAPRPGKALRFR
jgi:hypothetical protein